MTGLTDEFSFWTGVEAEPDLAVFLLGDDQLMEEKVPHTVVAALPEGRWPIELLRWTASAVCWVTQPAVELVIIGHEGEVRSGCPGTWVDEPHININRAQGKNGHLRNARTIDGRIYVVGMDRQVYRRIEDRSWESLDNGLPIGYGETTDSGALEELLSAEEPDFGLIEREIAVVGFEGIDGFSEREIYAVGHEGEIWCYDGSRWHSIPSPTNLILLGVHCASDGYVYACGQIGTLLRGRGDMWEVIDSEGIRSDFWDVFELNGTLYLATLHVLYEWRDGIFAPVDYGEQAIPFTFYRFARTSQGFLSIGTKDVMRFDGKTWIRLM
ncbi:hypothetical protein IF690_15475 [Pseudomonas sp. SK3(2021)]|uniref:hypothetical protein n=1 Tax=Pseudomonas sp. SK3(2021) TaxID=2841064 RepID=UPI001AF7415D|nr:hypothetical protein [Pseudomonas sp. SK3(2021)]QQZ39466.1 hypothetical protein IF690_15475 [Pseudomonas sp. SK3(2021)]